MGLMSLLFGKGPEIQQSDTTLPETNYEEKVNKMTDDIFKPNIFKETNPELVSRMCSIKGFLDTYIQSLDSSSSNTVMHYKIYERNMNHSSNGVCSFTYTDNKTGMDILKFNGDVDGDGMYDDYIINIHQSSGDFTVERGKYSSQDTTGIVHFNAVNDEIEINKIVSYLEDIINGGGGMLSSHTITA